jgi:hypothetical protein
VFEGYSPADLDISYLGRGQVRIDAGDNSVTLIGNPLFDATTDIGIIV